MIIFSADSCKKGENDPFISLKSRKARLVGEWKLVEGNTSVISTSGTDTYTFTESMLTSVESGVSTTKAYTESFTFGKDGKYKYSSNTDNGVETEDEEGVWTFGVKSVELDQKAKETVVLYQQKYTSVSNGTVFTYSYNGTNCVMYRFTLDMLKSNKMTLKVDYIYSGTSTSYNKVGTMIYEKQ